MPPDAGAWSILRHERMRERFGFEIRKQCGATSERQKKLRNVLSLPQLCARIIVFPTERHDAAFAEIPVKFKFAERQRSYVCEELLFV